MKLENKLETIKERNKKICLHIDYCVVNPKLEKCSDGWENNCWGAYHYNRYGKDYKFEEETGK